MPGCRRPSQPPWKDEQFFDPRLGVARKLGEHWALSASGFRAFREPSPNELYRATQVGAQLTLAEPELLSERATGLEAGVARKGIGATFALPTFLPK